MAAPVFPCFSRQVFTAEKSSALTLRGFYRSFSRGLRTAWWLPRGGCSHSAGERGLGAGFACSLQQIWLSHCNIKVRVENKAWTPSTTPGEHESWGDGVNSLGKTLTTQAGTIT